MPQLSPRITTLNGDGDDGWGVFYRARTMIAAGTPVTELTIGEHDIGTDTSILAEIHRSAAAGHTGYAMVPGVRALRDTVAARIAERTGVPTTYENILITPGGQAALFAAHMAVLSPGDAGLFIEPYYAVYPGTVRAASGQPLPVPTNAEDAFLPTYDQISAATRSAPRARSLLINTPNNPTGTIYPRETLDGIARACRAHDLWLISDEVYDTQVWEGEHLSPRALPGMEDRTLVIGSMSKSHAMTGSRIGWICAPAEVIPPLIDLATNTTYGVPGYIQDAALFALTAGPELETSVAEPFRRRRALALSILEGQDIVRVIPSRGAMYLMLDIRATGLDGQDFANRLLDAHRIAVMPGESFGTSGAGHLRVALTVADDRLAAALDTLTTFAANLARETA
ncbi:pyridoxal phosphate-dependent aminotransferase [Sagittula salina]|uniref:Aminotransferase n=1 Tax=Sagittula salina TaxID=2820268 RepID=A0A940MJN7_9RHOB|nr:pyridoxal phosphate-dependent aminotransferase [Sagittula salina]MBP0481005.1 pyridoxal phosphate-dependent aminotransferase [Sagittula salina]